MERLNFVVIFYVMLVSTYSFSQTFYFNSVINPYENYLYSADIQNLNLVEEYVCPATNNPDQGPELWYGDMAIDVEGNVYYISGMGSLYRKNLNEECEFLGQFMYGGNSLVADSYGNIYTASSSGLYRFNIESGIFTNMGNLPNDVVPAGDLFFYNEKLYLTAVGEILEINMMDVSESCHFIDLSNIQGDAYGAFSFDYGTHSKAYIINYVYENLSKILELDMENKVVGDVIYETNKSIMGAGSIYNLTSTNAVCRELSISDNEKDNYFINITNPAQNRVHIKTNLERETIKDIMLYDISGKLVKSYANNIDNLNISMIPNGIYLLQVNTNFNKNFVKKLIIKN